MIAKIIQRKSAIPEKPFFPEVHPVLARVYRHRGIVHHDQLARSLKSLHAFQGLKGMERAVRRLQQALIANERILIVGDFDADGATSTAVAVKGLRWLGCQQVDYCVPNRFDFGYGLSPELVDYAYTHKNPALIITVDNGISSIAGVQRANELGIDVVVTDHHLAGAQLPEAVAVVNPNQPGCEFLSKNLAGVGVIFYTLLALRALCREEHWFLQQNREDPNFADLLDIVALGTVADVVPLDQNNRILVYQGLERIRRNRACPGIQALLEVSQRNNATITATDLGFALGPRLNAAGRLEDMSLGIECLLAENFSEALALAQRLNGLNIERQALEQEMKAQALSLLENCQVGTTELPSGLCLYEETWHQGVIGILASRLKEKVHRPVICCALGKGDEIKGSARSIPGCHVRDVLANIANRKPYLLTKFGGHAMAAGLSTRLHYLPELQQEFASEVAAQLSADDLVNKIYSDGELQDFELTLELAQLLREAGPWGQSFPEPIFDDVFFISSRRVLGDKHLKMVLEKGSRRIDAIAFNYDAKSISPNVQTVHAAFRLDINEFRGQKTLQLIIVHLVPFDQQQESA